MELGALKNAIRKHKGTVSLEVTLSGHHVAVPIQKSGFMEVLGEFGNQRNHETGLIFNDGTITVGGTGGKSPQVYVDDDDLFDELLG